MRIAIKLAFHEQAAVRLLNWLAKENATLLQERPDLPLLYDSGVYYRREQDETWCDFINMLVQGHEDCDGLAAARAGELIARGWHALRPGDSGFEAASRLRPGCIPAVVFLRTRSTQDEPGLYHCVVRYPLGGQWYEDDPSARLGMHGRISADVKRRWATALDEHNQRAWRTT